MMLMKRIFLILFVIVILSGCHAQRFTYGSSQIELQSDLDSVLELMMDKGNYDDNLLVPYNRTSLAINYSRNSVVVEAVQFSVYRKFDGEEYHYDLTACFDDEGSLECKEERGFITGDKIEEEILLTESFEIFSSIDVPSIIAELRSRYNITLTENTLLQAHLVLPSDIEEDNERYENIVFYFDSEYHYDSTYEPQDMMLEIRVDFYGSGEGETYIIYFEIE